MDPWTQARKRESEEIIDSIREEDAKRIVKILLNSLSDKRYEILSISVQDLVAQESDYPTIEFRLRLAHRYREATPVDSRGKETSIVQNLKD